METACCKECEHFHRHYVLDTQSCTSINCGHCSYPRIKHRAPDHAACRHFCPRKDPVPLPSRERVLYFLTEEVLRHILSLQLPPEIKEG